MKRQIRTVESGKPEAGAYFDRLCNIDSDLASLGYRSALCRDNFAEDKINRVLVHLSNAEDQIIDLKAEIEALKKPKDIRVGDIVTVTGYGYPCGPTTNGKAYSFMLAKGEVARVNSAWVEINTKAFPPGAYELSRECVTKIERPAPTPPQPKPGDTKEGLVFRTGKGWMEISRYGMRDRRKSNDRLSKEINRLGQDIPRTPEETYALKAMIVTARGLDPKSPQVITPRDPNRTDRRKK